MENKTEVKQVSEREIRIGDNKYYLDEGNIFYITAVGKYNEKEAIEAKEITLRFLNLIKGKVDISIDLNKAGKQSPEARKIWKELSELKKVGKIALFGLHPVARILAVFVMGVTRKKDMRFFRTKEEALAWLKY
ncbi:MAG: STAS/SEC14 domain-containing protein [Bacteroidetes bacterium]|nr:STAS/SEC14 domain-containing protein [Bacteroidota bacterium]